MNILGINGWGNWFHDTSAALIVDGQIAAICEEERFTRHKHTNTPPLHTVKWCLQSKNLDWEDLDGLCVGWDLDYYGPMLTPPQSHGDFARRLLSELDGPADFPLEKIHFYAHHLCHAYSVIGTSLARDGLVLVVDGQGEENSTSLYRLDKGNLVDLSTMDSSCSLGYFYEAASSASGFGLTGTGKLMGLSSYGIPKIDFFNCQQGAVKLNFRSPLKQTNIKSEELDASKAIVDDYWLPLFHSLATGLPGSKNHSPSPFELRETFHQDDHIIHFAASVQHSLEKAVDGLLAHHLRKSDTNIFLAGGVALNCKNNGVLHHKFDVDLHIQPLSNDAGVALGAALYYADLNGQSVTSGDFPFIGPGFSQQELLAAIVSMGFDYTLINKPWQVAAELISQDQIVGWFQGKAEVGPRALGARSILARPDSTQIRDRINKDLKKRESWRPFGPSILEEQACNYFDNCNSSRYMLVGFNSKTGNAGRAFAGCIHIDDTARVQTVPIDTPNQCFRYLLETYYKITGIPGVLNTSFNRAGEPIVCSPEDALAAFLEMGLDALIIGHYLIKK